MKKLRVFALLLAIALILAGCSKGQDNAPENTETPATNGSETAAQGDVFAYPTLPADPVVTPETLPSDTAAPVPQNETLAPANANTNPYAVAGYSSVTSQSLALTMQYPTGWTNKPGRYTICYQQPAQDAVFPARIAVTVKTLKHTPEDKDDIITEFRTFFQSLTTMYEKDDFTVGDTLEETTFLGQTAYASTYVTTSGVTEVKGYCVITAVGRKLCVYHFCCAYDDYAAMEPLRIAVRDSVRYIT